MSILIPPIYLGKPPSPWDKNDPASEDRFYSEFANPPFSRIANWLSRRKRPSAAASAEKSGVHPDCAERASCAIGFRVTPRAS